MKTLSRIHMLTTLLALAVAFAQSAFATSQYQDFTYQGQLQQNGQPANGTFNLTFALFNAPGGGVQYGGTTVANSYPVTGGLFTIILSYPTAFTGTQLWLEVTVNGTTMSPRTLVATVPVAQYSLSGAIAPGSITSSMLANGAVTRAKIAGTQLTSSNIGLTVHAGNCGLATLGINGAQVGDLVAASWGNGFTPPSQLLLGPASVTAANTIKFQVCNVTGTDYSNASIPMTFQTFR